MAIKNFPQLVFITVENAGTEDEYLAASLNTDDAIGDDDNKIVGVYKFVSVNELISRPPLSVERKSKKTTK